MIEYTEGVDRCIDADLFAAWRRYEDGREVRVGICGPRFREAVKDLPSGASVIAHVLSKMKPELDAADANAK